MLNYLVGWRLVRNDTLPIPLPVRVTMVNQNPLWLPTYGRRVTTFSVKQSAEDVPYPSSLAG